MMRSLLLTFVLLLVNGELFGQTVYEWINQPKLAGLLLYYEQHTNDYWRVHDKVLRIDELVYSDSATNVEKSISVRYKNGKIDRVYISRINLQTKEVISSFADQFEYDAHGLLTNEIMTVVGDGRSLAELYPKDKSWFGPKVPDPIEINENGYSVRAAFRSDTTYSFYDEFGRKTMDSIPERLYTLGDKIKYYYSENTVICEHICFTDSDIVCQREEYTVDAHGNWIEKRDFGLFLVNGGLPYSIRRRKIVYE